MFSQKYKQAFAVKRLTFYVEPWKMTVPNCTLFSLIRVVCYVYIFPWKIYSVVLEIECSTYNILYTHAHTQVVVIVVNSNAHPHTRTCAQIHVCTHSHTMDCCVLCIQTCIKVWLTIGRHYLVVMIFYCNFIAQTRSASRALVPCTVLF